MEYDEVLAQKYVLLYSQSIRATGEQIYSAFAREASSLTLVQRRVVAASGSDVMLARSADLLGWIINHHRPLRDPADRAGERGKRGKHRRWEPLRVQCNFLFPS